MKRKTVYFFLIILSGALILVLQVSIVEFFPEHQGTDDKSMQLIEEIAPDYKPWVSSILEPQSGFSEKTIFFFQACLGLGIIVFYILKQQRKTNRG